MLLPSTIINVFIGIILVFIMLYLSDTVPCVGDILFVHAHKIVPSVFLGS